MNKEVFIENVNEIRESNRKDRIISSIDNGINKELIYNACRSMYLVALNAKPIKDGENLGAYFLYEDLENAKKELKKLIENFKELGYEETEELVFDLVKENYLLAATDEEKSSLMGMEPTYNKKSFGLYGIWYNRNEIPEEILVKIHHELDK